MRSILGDSPTPLEVSGHDIFLKESDLHLSRWHRYHSPTDQNKEKKKMLRLIPHLCRCPWAEAPRRQGPVGRRVSETVDYGLWSIAVNILYQATGRS